MKFFKYSEMHIELLIYVQPLVLGAKSYKKDYHKNKILGLLVLIYKKWPLLKEFQLSKEILQKNQQLIRF